MKKMVTLGKYEQKDTLVERRALMVEGKRIGTIWTDGSIYIWKDKVTITEIDKDIIRIDAI